MKRVRKQILTPEQKLRKYEYNRKIRLSLTSEQKEEKNRKSREKYAAMCPGKKLKVVTQTRQKHLERKYGLAPGQWDLIFAKQNKRCRICNSYDPKGAGRWHTDHCHLSNRVRGILCHPCNVMLGNASDDVNILRSAITYLTSDQT